MKNFNTQPVSLVEEIELLKVFAVMHEQLATNLVSMIEDEDTFTGSRKLEGALDMVDNTALRIGQLMQQKIEMLETTAA